MEVRLYQKIKYKNKTFKVTSIDGDFVTMKCTCGGSTVRLHKDQL